MPVKHTFQCNRADNNDAGAIQPSHWDANHTLEGLLALIDEIAPAPNTIFTLDSNSNPVMLPVSSLPVANSPAFTGVPTVPTAPDGTNSTQIASTAFVAQAIADLIASAPGALNTLKELADAIGDDANFAATMTNALALKAPLASPAFTGAPTGPTVSGSTDSSTKLATTAFVQAVIAAALATVSGQTFGQCQLTLSGSNLILLPKGGDLLTIAGVQCTIPSAGVTLAPTGLTAGTLYYIYATQTGGTVASLVASTTGHSTDTTAGNKGVEIQTGDNTKTLVGMAYCVTGPAWQDTAQNRLVRSWFNDSGFSSYSVHTSSVGPISVTTASEITTAARIQALLWAGEHYSINGAISTSNNTVGDAVNYSVGANGTSEAQTFFDAAAAGYAETLSSVYADKVGGGGPVTSEGLSFFSHYALVSSGSNCTVFGKTLTVTGVRR